ncbi:MAG: NADH-quinone oxidoreductase subunit NuoK [Actinobacteria bacterium]|nr:NADH-quinone oxidoreductase subunit NuoK [Actinomycetota bacterium]
MGVSLNFFLGLSAILFSVGLVGVLLRRSPLTILLSLEIMLNSVNLTLVAFSREVGGSDGQVFALIVMGIAAAEVVVGLGLVVAMTRREMVLDTDELRTLNG